MNAQLESHPSEVRASSREAFMMVSIDDYNILVPGQDIVTFESVHDMETADLGRHSVGWMRHSGNKLPVYCFTRDFEISGYLLEKRSICVLLNGVDLAFLCSDIKAMEIGIDSILPLPDCMKKSGTPVDGFCTYKQENISKTTLICSAKSIKKFIDMEIR